MGNHEIEVTYDELGYRARCTCRWVQPKHVRHKWEADDVASVHMTLVERVRMHLDTSTPTLKSQRNYYQQMAEHPDQSEDHKRIWKILANELDRRLNESHKDDDEPFDPLW